MARVGVDIDGVLYPFDVELKNALVSGGWRQAEECPPPTKWEFFEDWKMDRHLFVAYCDQFTNKHELFRHGDPYPGAAEQIDRLIKAGHEVILITNRNFGDEGVIQGSTQNWLFDHGFQYHELYFVKDKREISVDYHIDDNRDNHFAMLGAEVDSWLLTQPWNEHEFTFSRVRSLEEYVDYVLAREGTACVECGDDDPREGYDECGDCQEAEPDAPVCVDSVDTGEVRVTSSTGGQKGKKLARFSLIPAEALWEVAEHYGKGAEKYDDHNWRKGYDWSLSMDALERHWNLFRQGQDIDEETGSHHLCGVVFHALSLMTFGKEHPEFDDRFKSQ